MQNKHRVLAFHGWLQTADRFRSKTGAFRKKLKNLEMDAPILTYPPDKIDDGTDTQTYRSWLKFDSATNTYEDYYTSLKYVIDHCENNGPYDGILGKMHSINKSTSDRPTEVGFVWANIKKRQQNIATRTNYRAMSSQQAPNNDAGDSVVDWVDDGLNKTAPKKKNLSVQTHLRRLSGEENEGHTPSTVENMIDLTMIDTQSNLAQTPSMDDLSKYELSQIRNESATPLDFEEMLFSGEGTEKETTTV